MIANIALLVVGLAGLFWGGEWLVTGASRIARSFHISALVVGLTVVAFGTSAPELIISLDAALRNSSAIAIGNVVGSNIANIGLILGVAGLIYPISVRASLVKREIPFMIVVSVIAYLMVIDGLINRIEGFVLFVGLFLFIGTLIYLTHRDHQRSASFQQEEQEIEADSAPPIPPQRRPIEGMRVLVGLLLLVVGARLTVDSATEIARTIGVSELVIGLTLVAIGTSLPELVTSAVAAIHHQNDIAIGNVIGSNIFNLLQVLGLTAMVQPIQVDEQIIVFDGPVMIGFAVVTMAFVINKRIGRLEALFLLLAYIIFIGIAFLG